MSTEQPDLNPEKARPMTLEDWQRIQQGQHDAAEARAQALLRLGEELREDRSKWVTLYPLREVEAPVASVPWAEAKYLSLPVVELPFMAQAYINMIETERTNRLCRCEWIIHPDDVGKAEGTRRVHKGREAANCPVHTKLGFLLYFFDHYFRTECPACPPDCKSCLFTRDCECYEHQHLCPEDNPEITQDATAVAHDDQP